MGMVQIHHIHRRCTMIGPALAKAQAHIARSCGPRSQTDVGAKGVNLDEPVIYIFPIRHMLVHYVYTYIHIYISIIRTYSFIVPA